MTDNRMTELDSRERLNTIRARFGAGPTSMTDEQIEEMNEHYRPKLEADMAIIDEQAIAATLGVGECAQCAKDMGAYADSLCDPLKERVNELLRCLENDWHIRASWDGLRKFWCIELTEEGVRVRDAAHGTLTADDVLNAVYKHGARWQAIADELNATFGGARVKEGGE